MERALVLAAAWILWCALHSALIARPLTEKLKARLGVKFGYYRLFYNAVSVVSLAPLAFLHWRWAGDAVLRYRGAWLVLAFAMNLAAFLLFVLGARAYGMTDFLGLRSAMAAGRGTRVEPVDFSSGGILRRVRHPWYLAGALVLWGHDLDLPGLVSAGILTAYLLLGSWLEERKLVAEYGEAYRAYQRAVPMFIPVRFKKSGKRE